ncbi:MAG: 16S rRNA (guanine(966)-N(2))-methyltransferase RsmD [Candidatus Latescibacteria bacterium]|nr:16S rRNA (guanine(966)-N(2))-methyltransferase RsmD [Candidatus Latescibacterota bacterium]
MRVTSGVFRGRLLRTPRGIRPTQDRVRKSLFDVLGKDVPGRRVLDLFAGSGALGVEALSRGAVSALFVDEDAGAVRAILDNLMDLGLAEEKAKGSPSICPYGATRDERNRLPRVGPQARIEGQKADVEIWRADYRQAVRRMEREGRAFDLIVLDPPYREGLLPEVLQALTGAGVIAPAGLVVAEAEEGLPAPEADDLALIDERAYGGTKLMFWLLR